MLDEDMAEASESDLHEAAQRLGLVLTGPPVRSFFSVGSKARRDEDNYWLRVRRAHLLTWTPRRLGYVESTAVHGVPKPVVIDSTQWFDAPNIVRAEVLSFVPATVISPSLHLKTVPALSDTWWSALSDAVKNLADTPTLRDTAHVLDDVPFLRRFYGREIPEPTDWATEHEDPHWANITGPDLHILDWDFWGRQPRGFTVAGLYCTSLGVPDVSDRLLQEFPGLLNSPSGKWSILYHLWYRRKGLPSFLAWERAATVARSILRDLT
ncbi:hypothetical protein GCM10009839_84980 [Catenulispora yoronensis]|uniref:Aminoglycoside phosphotransferase domain-containing protein n=1 Tax=Catenulispora yoronensis TaxID=450799 RepID=A0ABP5H689_9ACTN